MKVDKQEKTLKVPSLSLVPLYPGGRTNFIFNLFVSLISNEDKSLNEAYQNEKGVFLFDYFIKLINYCLSILLKSIKK